mmetsp:Transcript_43265/g.109264  ORF Transcript_43265/g.109264 Transcript_43265/m.109264 type:complete len:175 (-) Transcript_43265:45-569(-)
MCSCFMPSCASVKRCRWWPLAPLLQLPEDFARQGVDAGCAAVLLPKTKMGPNQVALVRDPVGIAALRRLKALLTGKDWRWPSLYVFNNTLRATARELGVNLQLTSHCFRRGGALDDFMAGVPVATIMRLGRWSAHKSLNAYLVLSQFLIARFPPCAHPLMAACARDPRATLALL